MERVRSHDVVIVGGGPAGSTCATRLRRAGLDVLVLDKAAFPRDKPCAGWITPGVLERAGITSEDYAAGGRVLQAFTGFRTGRIGGPWVETDYGRPVSFGILRREFDDYLLRRSGARLNEATPVTRLTREADGWLVNDAFRSAVLVGAAGHGCPVARLLNGKPAPADVVAAQEVEFQTDARHRACSALLPEMPHLYFCRDLDGYGWCVRKGDTLNVGLGRREARHLRAHVDAFVDFLLEQRILTSRPPSRWRGYGYLLRAGAPRTIAGEGVLLVGDAAGCAVPESGEGIGPAIESGRIAADAILAGGGRIRRADAVSYTRATELALGQRRAVRRIAPAFAGLVGPLLGSTWVARRLILERWFLRTASSTA